MIRLFPFLLAMAVCSTGAWGAEQSKTPGAPVALKDPTLELRVTMRMGFPGTRLFTLELKGGDETEKFYCPSIEWDWPWDDTKSTEEGDCPEFEKRESYERRFTYTKYVPAGDWTVVVKLLRGKTVIASTPLNLHVADGIPSQ